MRYYRHPEIKQFIVQDLPETGPAADAYIASLGLSDRVKFEGHDFFKPQIRRDGKYVFVMQRGMQYPFPCVIFAQRLFVIA